MKNFLKTLYIKLFTIVGLSSFTRERNGSISYYRVTGYYYIYTYSDGERLLIPCPWIFANAIGGYGVCGAYIPFTEVHSIGFSFKRWFFCKQYYTNGIKRIYTKENLLTLREFYFKQQGRNKIAIQDELFDKVFAKMRNKSRKKFWLFR